MNAFIRPFSRVLYPLGITFSMLVLASSLNLVVDALRLKPWPLEETVPPSPPRPETPHWPSLDVGTSGSAKACEVPSVRIVPVRDADSGLFRGFRLFRIQPDSFASHFGLRHGDTARSIHGMDLSSHERALDVYTQLENASLDEVLIERNGKPLRHTYFTQK